MTAAALGDYDVTLKLLDVRPVTFTFEQGGLAFASTDELEAQLGANLRALRLDRNLDQATLAARAGVSLNALKHLEGGKGSTLKTLVRVLRALGREEWITTIAPVASINPLTMPRSAVPRQRAAARRKPKKDPLGS